MLLVPFALKCACVRLSGETILAFRPWIGTLLDGESTASASTERLPSIADVVMHALACCLPLELASIHVFVTLLAPVKDVWEPLLQQLAKYVDVPPPVETLSE